MRPPQEDVVRLRRLWDEHVHRPFPSADDDPRVQEVALYSAWLGSMVESALRRGHVDQEHSEMLKTRRTEGNQALFRAGGELGEPMRSYVARLITMEDLLSSLPVRGETDAKRRTPPRLTGRSAPTAKRSQPGGDADESRRLPARPEGPGAARGGDADQSRRLPARRGGPGEARGGDVE